MHEKLGSLKLLLKAGEYEKAAAALKEYQTEFPDDWNGKLMEGIVAKLQGDEETFRRIHDEAQTIIEAHGKDAVQIKTSPLWEKYHSTWQKITKVAVIGLKISAIGGLVATGIVGGAGMLNRNRLRWMSDVILYGPAEAHRRLVERTMDLYDAPIEIDGPIEINKIEN